MLAELNLGGRRASIWARRRSQSLRRYVMLLYLVSIIVDGP